MRKLALLFALLLLTVAAHAAELPDTPAGKTFAAWLESYNTHDLAARKEFLKTNSAMSAEQIDRYAPMDIEMREQNGKFEVVSATPDGNHGLAVIVRHAQSGQKVSINITVQEQAPHKIARIGLRPE